MDASDNYVDLRFLQWLKGFKSVYKPKVEEKEADKVVKISISQHLTFSHLITAFLLTEKRGRCLRGFFVLDPVGMPLYLMFTY